MPGPELLRKWTGVPLLTLMAFPRVFGPSGPSSLEMPALREPSRYCRALAEGVQECAVFDGGLDAPARGVQWMISERLHELVPAEQRACWRRMPSGEWVSRERAPAYRNAAPAKETMPPAGSGACP